jgi:hypothetical protein
VGVLGGVGGGGGEYKGNINLKYNRRCPTSSSKGRKGPYLVYFGSKSQFNPSGWH